MLRRSVLLVDWQAVESGLVVVVVVGRQTQAMESPGVKKLPIEWRDNPPACDLCRYRLMGSVSGYGQRLSMPHTQAGWQASKQLKPASKQADRTTQLPRDD